MSTMTEKERREAERRKRLRAASREFEARLGIPGGNLDGIQGGTRQRRVDDELDLELTETELAWERGYEGDV